MGICYHASRHDLARRQGRGIRLAGQHSNEVREREQWTSKHVSAHAAVHLHGLLVQDHLDVDEPVDEIRDLFYL
jgi:hypothetical protein